MSKNAAMPSSEGDADVHERIVDRARTLMRLHAANPDGAVSRLFDDLRADADGLLKQLCEWAVGAARDRRPAAEGAGGVHQKTETIRRLSDWQDRLKACRADDVKKEAERAAKEAAKAARRALQLESYKTDKAASKRDADAIVLFLSRKHSIFAATTIGVAPRSLGEVYYHELNDLIATSAYDADLLDQIRSHAIPNAPTKVIDILPAVELLRMRRAARLRTGGDFRMAVAVARAALLCGALSDLTSEVYERLCTALDAPEVRVHLEGCL